MTFPGYERESYRLKSTQITSNISRHSCAIKCAPFILLNVVVTSKSRPDGQFSRPVWGQLHCQAVSCQVGHVLTVKFITTAGKLHYNRSSLFHYCSNTGRNANDGKTSLLRRLQAQTLPDATPPIGKIHPFSKMAVTFEPLMGF